MSVHLEPRIGTLSPDRLQINKSPIRDSFAKSIKQTRPTIPRNFNHTLQMYSLIDIYRVVKRIVLVVMMLSISGVNLGEASNMKETTQIVSRYVKSLLSSDFQTDKRWKSPMKYGVIGLSKESESRFYLAGVELSKITKLTITHDESQDKINANVIFLFAETVGEFDESLEHILKYSNETRDQYRERIKRFFEDGLITQKYYKDASLGFCLHIVSKGKFGPTIDNIAPALFIRTLIDVEGIDPDVDSAIFVKKSNGHLTKLDEALLSVIYTTGGLNKNKAKSERDGIIRAIVSRATE